MNNLHLGRLRYSLAVLAVFFGANGAIAEKPIEFTNISVVERSGIDYQRVKSKHDILWNNLRSRSSVSIFDFATSAPVMSRGAPGVALFDYDNDGDMDIYVTNGPGRPNSLYSNRLAEGRSLSFIEVSEVANVGAEDMDSTGVCAGDTDNDGDSDLYVVGIGSQNRFFRNNADGTFTDVSSQSDVAGRVSYSTGCSMGDINGDGLLDIVVANTTQNWDSPIFPTDHNQLFLNRGDNQFDDYSDQSGITKLAGLAEGQAGSAGLTWSIAMVDYDLDSDVDIIMADDQSNYPVGDSGGIPGFVHIFQNDGSGHFRDVTVEAGMNISSPWMGFSFGDINSDGYLDMFLTNMGDYMMTELFPYQLGSMASKWFIGTPDLTFSAQVVTEESATAIGWGTVMLDYDNDGDTDIAYMGGMNGGPLIDLSNPGVILTNDGEGSFVPDLNALSKSGHGRRSVMGLAHGDLNGDGFMDLVSVSNFDAPQEEILVSYSKQWGSELDETAHFIPSFSLVGPMEFTWSGFEFDNGTLAIDINNGGSQNGSVAIELLGTVGMLRGARSNREGVGAVVSFTPLGAKTVMQPVIAGASYASQSELTAHFGLGKAPLGTVDVLWPGGTRNRLYGVKKGEKIRFPEIPCSYTAQWRSAGEYIDCVRQSLNELEQIKQLDRGLKLRLLSSAIKAYKSV